MINNNYYMKLVESRSKRLQDLLEMGAPIDMICKEVVLLMEATKPLDPERVWIRKENNDEECQSQRYKSITR